MSKESSEFGTRFEMNSPATLMSSVSASPRLIVPPRKVATPTNSDTPSTFRLPPTLRFFSIPTPPSTITAPVSLSVDWVVLLNVVIPEKSDTVLTSRKVPLTVVIPVKVVSVKVKLEEDQLKVPDPSSLRTVPAEPLAPGRV